MKIFALLAALCLAPTLAFADDDRIPNLSVLSDEKQRNAAKMFVDDVIDSNPPEFYLFLSSDGVTWFGKQLKKDQAKAKIDSLGIAGFLKMEQSKAETEAGSPWQFQVASTNAKSFQIYTGSGYGKTNVAILTKDKSGEYRLTAVKVIDFGAP
jgi:hypothetical protein